MSIFLVKKNNVSFFSYVSRVQVYAVANLSSNSKSVKLKKAEDIVIILYFFKIKNLYDNYFGT